MLLIAYLIILLIVNFPTGFMLKEISIIHRAGMNKYSTSSNCIFIGCSCLRDRIKCPGEHEQDNRLSMFPKRYIGKKYTNNITLDISNNYLEMIPDDRFAGLDVTKIDFSNNNIYKISPDSFRDIVKLEELDFNNNYIKYLSPNIFAPVENSLLALKIEENYLNEMETTKLTIAFSRLSKLKSLYLSKNKLIYMPDLSELNNLAKLTISSNQIEMLVDTETYKQLLPSSLTELNLEDNRLKSINENSFIDLINLKYLNLESNQISAIAENSFIHLTNLSVLNLRRNNLKHIPSKIFFTLINLEHLDLSSQKQVLKQIDDYAFDRQSNAKTIKRINLSNNRISIIENKAFCSRSNHNKPYVNIKELDVSFNHLSYLNVCLLRQLYRGYHDTSLSTKLRQSSRVLFKTTLLNYTGTYTSGDITLIECNCEVSRAAKIVDLEGSCKRTDNITLISKLYDCGEYSIMNVNQINRYCAQFLENDCSFVNDRLNINEEHSTNSIQSQTPSAKLTTSISLNNSTKKPYLNITTLPILNNNNTINSSNTSVYGTGETNIYFTNSIDDHYLQEKRLDELTNIGPFLNETTITVLTNSTLAVKSSSVTIYASYFSYSLAIFSGLLFIIIF